MRASVAAMGEHRIRPIRESEALAEARTRPSASDLLFIAGLSMAVFAGLALGSTLG